MRKTVALLLVICLASMLVTPAFASEAYRVTEENVKIERYENVWFYYEETDSYRIAMQLTDNGNLDYAYLSFASGTIVHNVDTVEVTVSEASEELAASAFDAKLAELLNHSDTSLAQAESYIVANQDNGTYSLQAIPSGHASMILSELIDAGYPAGYSNKLLATVHTGGYSVQIREQLVHQYVLDRNYALEVLTAITVISSMVGLAQGTLLGILEFSLSMGSYVLAEDSTLSKYDVTLVYTKTAEVGASALLAAGRQIRWKAYVGTQGAFLEQYSDTANADYYLSYVDFAEKAIENL